MKSIRCTLLFIKTLLSLLVLTLGVNGSRTLLFIENRKLIYGVYTGCMDLSPVFIGFPVQRAEQLLQRWISMCFPQARIALSLYLQA
jgi:hypothetical protein